MLRCLILSLVLLYPSVGLAETLFSKLSKLYESSNQPFDANHIIGETRSRGNGVKDNDPDRWVDVEAYFIVMKGNKYVAIYNPIDNPNTPTLPDTYLDATETFRYMRKRIKEGMFFPLTPMGKDLAGTSCNTIGNEQRYDYLRVLVVNGQPHLIIKTVSKQTGKTLCYYYFNLQK